MSIMYLVLGFILLVIGGEFLVRASVALSFKLNISKVVIGMTVVSFATSAPELLVSLQAALKGSPAIAINNVVGSNIANIALVLGVTALMGVISVDRSFYRVNWPVMLTFSGLLWYFLYNDNQLIALEGIVLFTALIIFIVYIIRSQKSTEEIEDVDDSLAIVPNVKILIWLVIGAVALYFGSVWLVDGATEIAVNMGVSQAVIGVTMIAIGTSVPELAASIIAVLKQEKAISLGNLIGSNIFNIGSVLGLTSIIKTIPVTDASILSRDIFWMILFAAIILPLAWFPKKHTIGRIKGGLLVVLYVLFIYLVFQG